VRAGRWAAALLVPALAACVLSCFGYRADYPAVRQGGLYMFNY
jgi:hypothetical protein